MIRLSAILLCIVLLAMPTISTPTRVALLPMDLTASPAGDQILTTLADFLRERLAECPSVRVVGSGREAAIADELVGGKRDQVAGTLREAYAAYLPVDALIVFSTGGGALHLTIDVTGTQTAKTVPVDSENWGKAIYQAVDVVGTALKLTADEQATLTVDRLGAPDIMQAYYPGLHVEGVTQIKLTQPAFTAHPESAALASLKLRGIAGYINAPKHTDTAIDAMLRTVNYALYPILGTPYEEAAAELAVLRPAALEPELLTLAKVLIEGDLHVGGALQDDEEPLTAAPPVTDAMRHGALRLLGVMRSKAGLKIAQTAAGDPDARLRAAAAETLGRYDKQDGLPQLRTLATDADPGVAFLAMVGLWRRGTASEGGLPAARVQLDAADFRLRRPALEVLATLGTADDVPLCRRLLGHHDPDVRLAAARTLLRIHAADALVPALLNDTDERVVLEALRLMPDGRRVPSLARMQALANDPHGPIAEYARLALAPCRPAGARERLSFDLAIEHPYLRARLVDRLAATAEPWALELLAQTAASNLNPHTRAHALKALLARDPVRATALLPAATRDPYRWVRLHAAALLADRATPAMAADLRAACTAEKDEATRLYLDDALARAEGKPLPAPRLAAYPVSGTRNLSWGCDPGGDTEHAPFDAYYTITMNMFPAWKKAHDAGKIVYGRVATVGNPGTIMVDPRAADEFWLTIDRDMTPAKLPYYDGFVFGEESMDYSTAPLWLTGWRAFCVEADIDPTRVNGDMSRLNPYEQRAWKHWAEERLVDGFNEIYDYVHLKYGKLRPGIQVATFIPGQSDANVADRRMKFDVGGAYDYKGDPRMAAYTVVRRYKTLWPDKPVIWLSLGIGGYEMNPVRRTNKVPVAPLVDHYDRACRDAATAYLAGADTGWFSTWIFVKKDYKGGSLAALRGIQVWVEDLFPGNPRFEQALKYAWYGAEDDGEPPPPTVMSERDEPPIEGERLIDIDEPEAPDTEQTKAQIATDQERFRRGFQFYRNYVYDCARIYASLPRQHVKPPALIVRPDISVWTLPLSRQPLTPGFELLNAFDVLGDLNQTPGCELARYRFIGVRHPDPLTDETIAAITGWLRDVPGVLYVHGKLTTDHTAEASSPTDHDGVLKNAWPWEGEVVTTEVAGKRGPLSLTRPDGNLEVREGQPIATFAVQGGEARVLLSWNGAPCLVLWRKAGFKGAVLFDGVSNATREYLIAIREALNALQAKDGVGMKLDGPILHTTLDGPITIDAVTNYCSGVAEDTKHEGVDFITTLPSLPVGRGQCDIIAKDYVGKYIASGNGVAVVGADPLGTVGKIDGGLRLQCTGLIRAGSETGALTVTNDAGVPLPFVKDAITWIVQGTEEGVAVLPIGTAGLTVTYIRSAAPVRLKPAQIAVPAK